MALVGTINAPNDFGFKNRIINGAMVIDQRTAGAEVNPAVSNTYYLDRWKATSQQTSKFKIGQNAGAVTPPTGFSNYLGCTSLSAYTVGASETFDVRQVIEGYNIVDLAWGTESAATVTLSFWVRSSLTGTFGGSLRNNGGARSYPFSYTISSANTWEQKTVTIAGDTSGTWITTNDAGIIVTFSLGVGSTYRGTPNVWQDGNYIAPTGATSVVGTNGATFYITGVQLEKGSTATSFDYRPYGTELALCQRYYYRIGGGTGSSATATRSTLGYGYSSSTTTVAVLVPLPVTMRSSPTLNFGGSITVSGSGYSTVPTDVNVDYVGNPSTASIVLTTSASTAALPRSATVRTDSDADAFVDFSAEM